jgi:hypothetical protein
MDRRDDSTPTAEFAPWLDWGIRILAILLLAGLVVVTITDNSGLGADQAAFAGCAILVSLALLAISLNRFSGAKSVKAFGFEVELAGQAMTGAPTAGLGNEEEGDEAKEIVDLQLLLEAKLAYVAKHVLARDPSGHWSSFATVGSLKYDKLLSREDAIAARYLLGLRASDIEQAPPAQRKAYLAEAKPFVGGIRATAFYNLVEKLIRETADERPRQLSRGAGRRPDLALKARAGERELRLLVFPAFSTGGGYWRKPDALRERAKDLAANSDAAMVVVPPGSTVAIDPPVAGVALVKVGELIEAREGPSSSGMSRLDAVLSTHLPSLAQSG